MGGHGRERPGGCSLAVGAAGRCASCPKRGWPPRRGLVPRGGEGTEFLQPRPAVPAALMASSCQRSADLCTHGPVSLRGQARPVSPQPRVSTGSANHRAPRALPRAALLSGRWWGRAPSLPVALLGTVPPGQTAPPGRTVPAKTRAGSSVQSPLRRSSGGVSVFVRLGRHGSRPLKVILVFLSQSFKSEPQERCNRLNLWKGVSSSDTPLGRGVSPGPHRPGPHTRSRRQPSELRCRSGGGVASKEKLKKYVRQPTPFSSK